MNRIEHTTVETVNNIDIQYSNAIRGCSENTKQFLMHAPRIIAFLGASLLSPKKLISAGFVVALINFKNPAIISDGFTGKLVTGISAFFVAKMLATSVKTFALFALALSTLYVGTDYRNKKRSACEMLLKIGFDGGRILNNIYPQNQTVPTENDRPDIDEVD